MFDREEAATASGRYRAEIVSGEMREKNHERNVQEALDAGSARGWRLVTGIYWDTAPER